MGAKDINQYFTAKATGDAITGSSAASSLIVDLGRVKPQIGVGQLPLYLCIRTVVAASVGGTLQFGLRKSATQSGGALSGTVTTILETPAMAYDSDDRVNVAGAWILRLGLPHEADQRYLDIYCTVASSAAITYEAYVGEPPSDKHTQLMESNVGQP